MDGHTDNHLLLLGRVEGKVDTLIHLQTVQSQRIDNIEVRMAQSEVDIITLKASSSTKQSILTNVVAVAALAVSVVAAYFGWKT